MVDGLWLRLILAFLCLPSQLDRQVPFVDCLTTMLDQTIPLTVIEWEE
jgi:hypothetical protein